MAATRSSLSVHRRGNTLVLVTALLVLLVIVATAYLSRTRGERGLAVATQQAQLRDDRSRVVGDDLAGEIAESLFVRPVPKVGAGSVPPLRILSGVVTQPAAGSNLPRLPIPASAVRHGADFAPGNPTAGTYDYNHPPFNTIPWTNWPDFPPYPRGVANPSGFTGLHDGNPAGNPGYGDNRWLRSLEPLRAVALSGVPTPLPGPDGVPFTDDDIPTYTHWQHLTNLARPENGYRLCYNIAAVDQSLITDLTWPVEQWLPQIVPTSDPAGAVVGALAGQISPASATYLYTNLAPAPAGGVVQFNPGFSQRWEAWLGNNGANHADNFATQSLIPPNFYLLNDLNGNGIPNEPGERPENAFDGPGSAGFPFGCGRWDVERVMTDTDGDGYTDAFWFLAPPASERGLRQLVAVSVVDNGGLLNVNTASRFTLANVSPPNNITDTRRKTIGATPADVALVGQNVLTNPLFPYGNWNAGYFDTVLNHAFDGTGGFNYFTTDQLYVQFQPEMFETWTTGAPPRARNFLSEIGVKGNGAFPLSLTSQDERSRYFRSMGTQLDAPADNLRPFTFADELELRMYRGRNNASILSRLERAVDRRVGDLYGGTPTGAGNQRIFLRSDDFREETNGFFNILSPPALVKDNRSKLTTWNATRNDLMPPWLWPSPHPDATQLQYVRNPGTGIYVFSWVQPPALGTPEYATWVQNWNGRIRKVDLRDTPNLKAGASANDQLDPKLSNAYISTRTAVLRDAIERAFAEVAPDPQGPASFIGHTYVGNFSGGLGGNLDNFRRLRKLCDSFANNIIAAADRDDMPITVDRLYPPAGDPDPYPDVTDDSQASGGPKGRARRYPGFERQPFLVESFVAHVYPVFTVPPGYKNSGDRTVFSAAPGQTADQSTTIFAVTIANPFDTPLPLRDDPATPQNELLTTPTFELEIFGKQVPLKDLYLANNQLAYLPSCQLPPPPYLWSGLTDLQKQAYLPRTLTLYAIASDFGGIADWKQRWLDFLDLPQSGGTDGNVLPTAIAVDLNNPAVPSLAFGIDSRAKFDDFATNPIRIVRIEVGADGAKRRIVVDRIDLEEGLVANAFRDSVQEMKTEAPLPPIPPPPPDPLVNYPINPGWNIDGGGAAGVAGTHWVQWRRVARAFGYGRAADRAAPQFISADKRITKPEGFGTPIGGAVVDTFFNNGNLFRADSSPDLPWFTHKAKYFESAIANQSNDLVRKPTTFNLRYGESSFLDRDNDGNPTGFDLDDWYPDTGMYWNEHSIQMLLRNRDFDRIGELSQVWLWGPELDVTNKAIPITVATFSEIVSGDHPDYPPSLIKPTSALVNRLWLGPTDIAGQGNDVLDKRFYDGGATPTLDAAARLFDAFVCDDGGLYPDIDGNGLVSAAELEASRYRLANGYSGKPVQGLINVNSATPEVMRAMPHMYRLAHEVNTPDDNPRVRLPEAIVAYRDKSGPKEGATNTFEPGYGDRGESGGFDEKIRPERGIASIGEIEYMSLQPTSASLSPLARRSWSSGFAGDQPFPNAAQSARVSTDTLDRYDIVNNAMAPDYIVGDVEEQRLLFTGISNLVTTRSDTFTVYFKVRTFRQDPVSGLWDATKRENIVDESRYMMVVDRSEVNRPTDRPKILLFEKLQD